MTTIEIDKANEEALALVTARALRAEKALTEIASVLLNDRPVPPGFEVEPEAVVWQVRELKRQLAESINGKPAITVRHISQRTHVKPGGTD
jgi:hypothetical protein